MDKIEKWVRAHLDELEDCDSIRSKARKVTQETGYSFSSARKVLARVLGSFAKPASKKPACKKPAKVSAETATRNALLKGVSTLKNDDEILTFAEFMLRCGDGYHSACLTSMRMEAQFRPYQFRKGSRVYWCTPSTKDWAVRVVAGVRDI